MSSFSWELDNQTEGQKAEFVKFPEGITRIRIVDKAPYQRWTHFIPQLKRSINCPGKGCPICEMRKNEKANKLPNKYNMSKRFAINVLNRETNRVEILEQGKTFMQDLVDIMKDLQEEHHTLEDADLKVRRRGTGREDTSYRIDVDKVTPLSKSDEEKLEGRIKLDEYFKPHTPEQILRILNGEEWNEVMSANSEADKESLDATEPSYEPDEDIELS